MKFCQSPIFSFCHQNTKVSVLRRWKRWPAVCPSSPRTRAPKGTVAMVGHEPMLSELASLLLHLQGPLEFRKGAAMLLVTQGLGTRGPARLEWFLTPRVLRELAGKD